MNSTLKLVKRHDPRGIRVAGEGKTTQELEDAKAEWPLEIMEGKAGARNSEIADLDSTKVCQ